MLNVHLRIADAATGQPTPVRVRVVGPDGFAHFPPLGRAAEIPCGRNEDVGGHLRFGRELWWYIDGACELPLPAGVPLRVQATKGPEFVPLDELVTLGTGQIALRFALSRWTDSRADGWMSIDTRCHFLSPHAALLEAQAEDLDVANLLATPFPVLALDAITYSTTPNLLAFSGQEVALERDGCSVVVNTFNTHPVLGKVALLNSHRPVFPLAFGGEDTDDWGLCDWCDQCHRKQGLTVWADAFEPSAGVMGGEALVAALLGKIDAIEVTSDARKVPLIPWVYRLWDAGFLLPLVGASGKDSNKIALGTMRTYAHVSGRAGGISPPTEPGVATSETNHQGADAPRSPNPSWLDAVRAGHTVASAGPLLTLTRDGDRFHAAVRVQGKAPVVEIVANGQVVTTGSGEAEVVVAGPGWVAARCPAPSGFAHTSPLPTGEPARHPEAVAALRAIVKQTREWIETAGQFTVLKRKQAMFDRTDEAAAKLEDRP